MDNTSKKLFKKSFMGGFNREDVANYIADLAGEHSREMGNIKAQLSAAECQAEELGATCKSLENDKKDLLGRVDELSAKVIEGDAAKAELLALKEAYSAMQAENESLKNALSASELKVNEYRTREEEFTRSKEQIANLELDARNRSKQIEEETKSKMDAEMEKLDAYRKGILSEVEALVAEMGSEYQETKNAVNEFKLGFKSVVTDLARGIDTIAESSLGIENAFNALQEKCKNMQEGK